MSSRHGKRSQHRSKKRKKTLLYTLLGVVAVLIAAGVLAYYLRVPQRMVYPLKFKDEITASSMQYGLEPCLVAAVINTESGFDPEAVSSAGAVGLMQLLPATAEWAAGMRGMTYNEALLTEPQYNIDMGCWLLSYLLQRYDNNLRYALIAYNAGNGTLERWLEDESLTNEKGELTEIPYKETRNYVDRIEKRTEQYRKAYGDDLSGDFE